MLSSKNRRKPVDEISTFQTFFSKEFNQGWGLISIHFNAAEVIKMERRSHYMNV